RPAGDSERLEFAQLCELKQRFAAAAGLYAEAFASQPRLAADLRAGHRYNAACSAARAGCGQGADAAGVAASDRLRWRRRALTWRGEDVVAWSGQVGGNRAANPLLERMLPHWQTDADLAGLRDPTPLARLPAEERAACERLWADVAKALRRTRPKK